LGVRDQRFLSDFNPGGSIHLDALIPDIFWFSKDYCGPIQEKKGAGPANLLPDQDPAGDGNPFL
jgi:hypothetical protein